MATAYHNLSDYDFNSVPNAENMRFGIVVSEWNNNITGHRQKPFYGDRLLRILQENKGHSVSIIGPPTAGIFSSIFVLSLAQMDNGFKALIMKIL